MTATRLYIAPNTRLQTVWRCVGGDGRVTWQVWTACHDRNAPFNDMLGTFMQLHPTGAVDRVTLSPDGTERIMEVMPQIGDDE